MYKRDVSNAYICNFEARQFGNMQPTVLHYFFDTEVSTVNLQLCVAVLRYYK